MLKFLKKIFINSYELIRLFEYDLQSDQELTIGKYYSINHISKILSLKIQKHLKMIFNDDKYYDIFHIPACCLMYSSSMRSKLQNFYYFFWFFEDKKNFSLKEYIESNLINISENNLKFLGHDLKSVSLYYIGIDSNTNKFDKVGFLTNKKSFLDLNPEKYYDNYTKINKVLNFIKTYYNNEFLALQYSSQFKKFFGVEISVKFIDLFDIFYFLLNCSLIDKKEYLNFNAIKSKHSGIGDNNTCIIKFRWQNEKKFTIKLYIQKQLHLDKFF